MAWTGHLVMLNSAKNNEATLIDHNVKITFGSSSAGRTNAPAKLPLCRMSGEEAILMLAPMPDKGFDKKLKSTELAKFPVYLNMTTLGGYVRLNKYRRQILGHEVLASELEDAFLVLSRGPENACDATMSYKGILYMAGTTETEIQVSGVAYSGDATSRWVGCTAEKTNLATVEGEKHLKELIAPARLFPHECHGEGERREGLEDAIKKKNDSLDSLGAAAAPCFSNKQNDIPGPICGLPSSPNKDKDSRGPFIISEDCGSGEAADNLSLGKKDDQKLQLLAGRCMPLKARRSLNHEHLLEKNEPVASRIASVVSAMTAQAGDISLGSNVAERERIKIIKEASGDCQVFVENSTKPLVLKSSSESTKPKLSGNVARNGTSVQPLAAVVASSKLHLAQDVKVKTKHQDPDCTKKLVPYFPAGDASTDVTLRRRGANAFTGQEQALVRLVLADEWQICMLEPHVEQIEFDTSSTIYQHHVIGENVVVISIVNGNPGITFNKILGTILSDMSFRQQECFLIIDSLSIGTITGQQGGTKRRIEMESGAKIEVKKVEDMDFDIISELLPNEKMLSIRGNKAAIVMAANSILEMLFKSYRNAPEAWKDHRDEVDHFDAADFIPPVPSSRYGLLLSIEARLLIPRKVAADVATDEFLEGLRRQTTAFLLLYSAQDSIPLFVQGTPRDIREVIFLVFKAIVDRFCFGNFELFRMSVQFKEYQMVPQDLYAFADVAHRTGCEQHSDWRSEDVTFKGNLFNILAALSYMIGYY